MCEWLKQDQKAHPASIKTSTQLKPFHNLAYESEMDLVVSNLSLHWSNDIEDVFKSTHKALKPDGVFLAALLGEDTLYELRTAMTVAEQEREGGLSPHISPMMSVADCCASLSGSGFNMVTADVGSIQVDFDNAFACMHHLSGMGESNASLLKREAVQRDTMLATAAIYQSMFGTPEGTVPATFDVVFLIGWKPHKSQPKPLEPGQIDVNFKDLKLHLEEADK